MASLSDILTSAQNIAQAINSVAAAYLSVQGSRIAPSLAAATLVKLGAGRIAVISITVAGSANGHVYDTNTAAGTGNPIFTIPNTIGVIFVNLPVSVGLVVAPGTGQTVTVSYS
jgi:hypothetical protein